MIDKILKLRLRILKTQGEYYRHEKAIKDAYAKYIPDRKKKRVSNIMLTVVIVAVVMYTIASFWLTHVTGLSIDPTLTTCFYTFFGSELFLLAGIKTSKVIKGYNKVEQNDDCVGDEEIIE